MKFLIKFLKKFTSASDESLHDETTILKNLEISFDSEFIPGDSAQDHGFYSDPAKINFSIEKINISPILGNLKVQLSTNCVLFLLPVIFILTKPNLVHAENLMPQQQTQFSNFKKKTEVEEKISKKIVVIDLKKIEREQKISQIDEEISENAIFQVPKQNLKLPLSNKKEGIYNPIKFSLLAKSSNIKILSKQEKTIFNFSIKWLIKNKILILSFGVGILICSLVIYYGFQKNNILNIQKQTPILTPQFKVHDLTPPKEEEKVEPKMEVDSVENKFKDDSDKNLILIEPNKSTDRESDSVEILPKSQQLVEEIEVEKIKNEKNQICNNQNLLLQNEHSVISLSLIHI